MITGNSDQALTVQAYSNVEDAISQARIFLHKERKSAAGFTLGGGMFNGSR